MIFEYQTKKTFDEIIESLNHFKKLQNENLFSSIEEFDFQNLQVENNQIIINRDFSPLLFKTGIGIIKYNFIHPEIVSINIESNQNLKKFRTKYSLLAIIFLIIFNIISIFLYKDLKISLIVCSFLFLILQYSFYTILDKLNSKFLKDYAIRFIKKLDKE